MKYNFIVNESGERIDKYLATVSDFSRNEIQNIIKEGNVFVDDKIVKSNYKLSVGEKIEFEYEFSSIDLIPQKVEFEVVFEDDYIIVINKPKGLVVHPGVGNPDMTLVNGLLYKFDKLSDDEVRPGIVHRIDKDTTGLLIVAKTNKVHTILAEMIKNREVKREYIALVHGNISHKTGTVDAPIGRDKNDRQKMCVTENNSKHAITHFEVLDKVLDFTLIKCQLDTGRTHQIRVHLKYINHPIVGDLVYGRKKTIGEGQLLHAFRLSCNHPVTGENLIFTAKLPSEFKDVLDNLKFQNKGGNYGNYLG